MFMRLRGLTAITAVALVSPILVTSQVSSAEIPPASALQAPPELAEPAVATVDLTCQDGQVDLNTASTTELLGLFDLGADELPVAERIVATRPHYAPLDLLVVAGIGPGRLRRIEAGDVCATPILEPGGEVPPLSDEFCRPGDGRIDVNVADADEINQVLPGRPSKTKPTAQRIADRAAISPFPTIDHVSAVPGVGPGMLRRIGGRICLTPAPFRSTSADGQAQITALVFSDSGVRLALPLESGIFSLAVPESVIANPIAWAQITQVTPARWDDTVVDLHIYSDWFGTVWAGVPTTGIAAAGWQDLVGHIPSDGSPSSWNVGVVDETSQQVVAPLTSLSRVFNVFAPVKIISAPSATSTQVALRIWDFTSKVLDYRTDEPTCPDSNVDYPFRAEVSGTYTDSVAPTVVAPGGLWCNWVSNEDARLRTTLRNNRNLILQYSIESETGENARFVGELGGVPSTPVGLAFQALFGIADSDGVVRGVAPGGSLQLELDPLESGASLDVSIMRNSTATYAIAGWLIDTFLPDQVAYATVSAAIECVYPILANDFYAGGLSAEDAVSNLYSCLAPHLKPVYKELGEEAVGTMLSNVLLFTDVGTTVLDAAELEVQRAVEWFTGDDQARVEYEILDQPGPYPLTDLYGRTVIDECVSGGDFDPKAGFTEFVLDQSCQNANYGGTPDTGGSDPVDNDIGGTRFQATATNNGLIPAHPDTLGKVLLFGRSGVPDGYVYANGDFGAITNPNYITCLALAARIPVRYDTPASVFGAWVEPLGPTYPDYGGGSCTPPVAVWAPDGIRNFILHNPRTGESHLLDAAGDTIHPIPDGGTFNCLAQSYLVYETTNTTGRTFGTLGFEPYPVGAPATCP